MINSSNYYFEMLPLHPLPEHLETFTSYLTRLAEANGIKYMTSLAVACFFDQYVRQIKGQKDNPPRSFGELPMAANCSTAALLATTFFHLGRKFERPGLPQTIAHFLSGMTARYLRYCPLCIAETPYYRLSWRFLLLPGCARHKIALLNKCGYCDYSIPLFKAPFKIGFCPHCQGDLRSCQKTTLTLEELASAITSSQDLEFLLSPQPWEAQANAKRIGAYFANLRHERQLTIMEVASQIGTTRHGVEAVEYGNIGASSSPFARYVKYARFLHTSMQEIFEATMLHDLLLKGPRTRKPPLSEDEVIERLQQAIQQLNDLGKPVTQRALSKVSGIARNRFPSYPRARDLLRGAASNVRTYKERQREQRQEDILEQVQVAIGNLDNLGVPVTQKAIAEIVGMTPPGLKNFPKVKELLARYAGQHCYYITKRKSLHEEELVAKIELAIKHLIDTSQPLTQVSIARVVGVGLGSLKKYPKAREIIEQHTARDHRNIVIQKENALLENVEEAVKQLTVLGERVTQRAISNMVGVDPSHLKRYPRVAALLERYANRLSYESRGQSQSREDYLVIEVKKAIELLENTKQTITQIAIAEILGVPLSHLKIYEQVDILLKQVASRAHHDRNCSAQAYRNEDEVVLNVEKAIEQLKISGEAITQRSVSRIMSVPASSLYYYPKVIAIFKTVIREERCRSRLAETQSREDDFVIKVLGAIKDLQMNGRTVSIGAIVKIIQVSDSNLKRYPKVKLILDQIVRERREKLKSSKETLDNALE